MTIDVLLDVLAACKVTLYLDGDRLRFRAPANVLSSELRDAIDHHRGAIIERLKREGAKQAARCGNCQPRNWVDEPPKQGRIRTHCGACGRFIGYRPVQLLDAGGKTR